MYGQHRAAVAISLRTPASVSRAIALWGIGPRLLVGWSMAWDRFIGKLTIAQFVPTGECLVHVVRVKATTNALARAIWGSLSPVSLAGAKLKFAGFAGFAGCANTLHARGPTNLKSPSKFAPHH